MSDNNISLVPEEIENKCNKCLSAKYNIFIYHYKCDGERRQSELCLTCCKTSLQFEKYIKELSVTGLRCLTCSGEKKDSWHRVRIMYDIYVYCSMKCEIIHKRGIAIGCKYCHKVCESNQRMRCSGCRITTYCNQNCHKKDWNDHKNECKNFAESHRAYIIKSNIKETCYVCFKESTKGFKQCAGCKRIAYCSETCQKAHWKSEHKAQCKELQNQYPIKIE